MTIFTAPVGYGVAYTPANVSAVPFGQKVNPHKDCIFIDPRTGELTTIRPGVTPPEDEKKKGKIIILATHIKEDINSLCDEIYLVENCTIKKK